MAAEHLSWDEMLIIRPGVVSLMEEIATAREEADKEVYRRVEPLCSGRRGRWQCLEHELSQRGDAADDLADVVAKAAKEEMRTDGVGRETQYQCNVGNIGRLLLLLPDRVTTRYLEKLDRGDHAGWLGKHSPRAFGYYIQVLNNNADPQQRRIGV